MFARLIKKGADAHFLCFPGMKKTDSNTIFQIQRETQIALTEATLLLSVVHMFLKMWGGGESILQHRRSVGIDARTGE